jgi:arginase
MVAAGNLDGYWIHIDVDVLDDRLMPAVDSRQDGGLNYDEFKQILRNLVHHQKAAGLEITILDPDLDEDGKYGRAFVENLASSLLRPAAK